MRVGFCWKGSTKHRGDRRRSTGLALWEPLFRLYPKTAFICLQWETTPAEDMVLMDYPNVAPPPGRMADFYDTMLYLTDIDLVVTVDTALAHLAGSRSIPTWLLLAASPDYRWQAKGETTPWYPSIRLYRQEVLGEWRPVFDRVADDLGRHMKQEAA